MKNKIEKKFEKNKMKSWISLPIIVLTLVNGMFAILSIKASYAASQYLYDSKEVGYDNNTSKLLATDVQGAIDELYACATDYEVFNTSIKNQIYPVGSIYISVNSTNPSTLFGGTWIAFGTGRTLVGMGSNGTDNFTIVGDTGGSSKKTLQTTNLPSHNHAFTPAGSVSSSFTGTKKSTESAGSHKHYTSTYNLGFVDGVVQASTTPYWSGGLSWNNGTRSYTSTDGSHSHYFTPEGSVSSSFTGTKGNTENTGSGTAFSTMDPYITVYMWKRTA